jgi:hypothetical protein
MIAGDLPTVVAMRSTLEKALNSRVGTDLDIVYRRFRYGRRTYKYSLSFQDAEGDREHARREEALKQAQQEKRDLADKLDREHAREQELTRLGEEKFTHCRDTWSAVVEAHRLSRGLSDEISLSGTHARRHAAVANPIFWSIDSSRQNCEADIASVNAVMESIAKGSTTREKAVQSLETLATRIDRASSSVTDSLRKLKEIHGQAMADAGR